MRILSSLLIALAMLPIGRHAQQPAAAGAVPFDKGWTLEGDRIRIAREDGRDVLQVENGYAHRRDIRLLDGSIDFDVRLSRRRSFVYVYFRDLGNGEREEFYLRPHKSGLPDAVQYAPVWQDRSAWQLHHGPGGTAAAPLADGRWIHVRVVVEGRRAAIFLDDMKTPALLVPELARAPQAGSVSVGGFLPANVPGEGPIATFANVRVQPNVVPFDLMGAPAPSAPTAKPAEAVSVINEWSVSRAFVPPTDHAKLPGNDIATGFERFSADPSGLLRLERHIKVLQGERLIATVARVTVRAPRAGIYAFDLGYSDIATVFVNGAPVFRGDASYSFDRPRREGLIGFDQARLYLPLREGSNDLSIVVSEIFGGWGLMGRFVAAPGLTASAQ